MRTKKKNEAIPSSSNGTDKSVENLPSEPIPGRERFQLSFDLNEDGTPDLTSMRGRTKEKVQQFFSDPRMASAFGAKVSIPEVQIFHPSMVAGLYAALGAAEAIAAEKVGKVPSAIAKQVFTYTPQEIELLSGPTVRVLNKYAADWMIKYQDEIALATLLVSITVAKVNVALTLSKVSQGNSAEAPKKDVVDSDPHVN